MRRIKSSLLAILLLALAAPPLAAEPDVATAGERSPEKRPATSDELAQYEQRDQQRDQQRKQQGQEDFEGGRGGAVPLTTVLLILLIVILILIIV